MPGYADIAHPTPTEHATVRFVINHQKPAIVLVAFGAPWQEAWAIRHQELLGAVGTKLVMAVGGSIDFMLGKVPRAPKFMRQFGLEWLFRLVLEPWRWQRQLRLVSFVQLLLSGKLQQLPMAVNTTKKDAAWRD
jgi:N-acetylglucosaminyldiphosphoundecaprenol N-acetyl-beta-D-mannosaminyltransferase